MRNSSNSSLIITRTELHARELISAYGLARKNTGETVWNKPDILSFREWITEAWLSSWPAEQLLYPIQELSLYRGIIRDSEAAQGLLSTTGVARLAQHADTLLKEYQLVADDSFAYQVETAAFSQWLASAEKILKAKAWVGYSGMVNDFIALLQGGKCLPASKIMRFTGFISFTPQQQRLLDVLRECGMEIDVDKAPDNKNPIRLQRYDTVETEVRGVADSIRKILDAFIDEPSNAPSIGVIVPNIDLYRTEIDAIFKAIITPTYLMPGKGEPHFPWRYGTGLPLSEHELIRAGLDVLDCKLFDNDINLITRILLNKRFGNGPEYMQRASLDINLRQNFGPSISLQGMLNTINTRGDGFAPRFAKRLRCLMKALEDIKQSRSPSGWADNFRQRLECLGWPGDDALSSAAYQALSAWNECLMLFSAMDRQMGEINADSALTLLKEILLGRSFQARVSYYQPVKIISYNDVPGLNFKHAFVLGMSAETLPDPAVLHPLIPTAIQQNAGMHLASPELALAYAEKLFTYLSSAGEDTVCSCPLTNDNAAVMAASPLIDSWPSCAEHGQVSQGVIEQVLAAEVKTFVPDADPIPPVLSVHDEGIQGGVSILQNFAEMPFIAFCRARLGLQSFPVPRAGLNKAKQGTLVHKVLEEFWGIVNTSQHLQALNASEEQGLLMQCLEKIITDDAYLPAWRYGKRLVGLEKERILSVVTQWLSLEKKRTDEFTVIACELEVKGSIHALSLVIKIDRIDEITLSDGSKRYLLVDYKTGSTVTIQSWSPESLTEVQLPLYATIDGLTDKLDIPVNGIAFAHVAMGKFKWHMEGDWTKNLIDKNRVVEEKGQQWAEKMDAWREVLQENALSFLQGAAGVNTVELRNSHYHNDLAVLVRDDL